MPDSSATSLYVVPGFVSMHFSYLYTTSLLVPLFFLRLYLVVWICCSSFQFPVVNILPTPAIVIVALVSRLLEG